MDGPARATHFSRTGPFTSSYTTVSAYVTARLFIRASMAVHHGPAYLFTTGSAPVPSDGGDSWPDYIPWHPSHGFTGYALRLTRTLRPAFGLGSPLQTDSPLHSPLSYPGLPDGFARDNRHTATHLSRCMQMIAFCHIRLVEVQIHQLLNEDQNQFRIFPLLLSHGFLSMLPAHYGPDRRTFSPRALHPYRPTARTLGRIIFHAITDMVSPTTLCG